MSSHPGAVFLNANVRGYDSTFARCIYICTTDYSFHRISAVAYAYSQRIGGEMMGLVKVRHGRYSSAVVVPKARGASRSHDPGRNGAYTRYTSMLAVLVVFLALPLADANAQVDDCYSCDVGTYAPVKGSESCVGMREGHVPGVFGVVEMHRLWSRYISCGNGIHGLVFCKTDQVPSPRQPSGDWNHV